MELVRCILLLSALLHYASIVEATVLRVAASPEYAVKESGSAKVIVKGDQVHISPELEPKSDTKFFKKDYPNDQMPVANPFHFKHPYPVVQDSGDFDKDFVKDENSDNGSWKAQETYDRLRAKLAKEKRDLAAALEKKEREEKELEEAKKQHDQAGLKSDEAQSKADKLRREHRKERKAASQSASKGTGGKSSAGKVASASEAKAEEVEDATEQTKDAVDSLEDCKKQLAEARKRLKEVMKELEEAKAAQEKADAAADEAAKKELLKEQDLSTVKKKVDEEHEAYQLAKKKHEKAEADLKEYEAQMKVARAKVQKMRDAEDPEGGVYPTPQKSGVMLASYPRVLMLAACLAMAASAVQL